jgi:hypothetical protein
MAETLGSLVDKLTIKDIRGFHIERMMSSSSGKFSKRELMTKLAVLKKQKACLVDEIDAFVAAACISKTVLKDDKLKLYNAREEMGRIPKIDNLGKAISGLACKNLELWNLEDEARRTDVDLGYIGGVKRKIDLANQQRNDFIDKIDELFAKVIKNSGRKIKA